jgi:hypothetical protein
MVNLPPKIQKRPNIRMTEERFCVNGSEINGKDLFPRSYDNRFYHQ